MARFAKEYCSRLEVKRLTRCNQAVWFAAHMSKGLAINDNLCILSRTRAIVLQVSCLTMERGH
jgi:hypothetical protein